MGDYRKRAWWSSLVAFFASLGSFTVADWLVPGDYTQAIAALATALIVAGAVYARERLKQTSHNGNRGGSVIEPETDPPPPRRAA